MTEDSRNDNQNDASQTAENPADGHEAEQSSGARNLGPAKAGEQALVMVPWQGLLVALLAGLVVWGTLEIIMPVFMLPDELAELADQVSDDQLQEKREASAAVRVRNATLSVVLMACTLAFALTVAELLFRGDPLRAAWGGLLAGLIAGVIAIGAGAAGGMLIGSLRLEDHRLVKTMIVQTAVLGATGLGIGLGMSMSMFRPRLLATCVAGCLFGGLLAALAFPVVAGIFLPNVNTESLMPDPGIGRLLWIVLPAGLIGVTVTGLGKQRKMKGSAKTSSSGDPESRSD